MPGQLIVTSDSQQFNNFTQTRQMYAVHMSFGEGLDNNSTPIIVAGDVNTQRFAIAMPTIGVFRQITVLFKEKTGGLGPASFDFRLYNTPWGANRVELYDKVYEKKNIAFEVPWDHVFGPEGLPFFNRVGYDDVNPLTSLPATHPRNFLWAELVPNGSFTEGKVWVTLIFEV